MAKVCIVCSRLLQSEESIEIKVSLQNKLINLFDKLYSNIKKNSVVCMECLENVTSAYNFKLQCLETDAQLLPHIQEGEQINLKFVNEQDDQEEILEVCRLCLKSVDLISIIFLKEMIENDVNVQKLFQDYIPNLNFEATANPVVCEYCQKSIIKFTNILFFLDNQFEDGKGKIEDMICNDDVKQIKCEENDYKENLSLYGNELIYISDDDNDDIEDNDDNCDDTNIDDDDSEANDDNCNEKNIEEDSEANDFENDEVSDTEDDNRSFIEEISIEVVPNGTEELEEDESSEFDNEVQAKQKKTKRAKKRSYKVGKKKSSKRQENKVDPNPPNFKRFLCDICGHKIRTKKYLTEHRKIHKHLQNCPNRQGDEFIEKCETCENLRKIFMCEFCGYRSKVPRNFKIHLQSHQEKDRIYHCNLCNFKTTVDGYVTKHIRRMHQDPSEIVWYKCPFCDYQTRDKSFLSRHILVMHEEIDEKDMFKCEICDFKTKVKDSLKKHNLIKHTDLSQTKTYQCELCDYKTKFSAYLSRHKKNKHTDLSELKMFECCQCPCRFKYSNALKNHMLLKHKNLSKLYKCELCDFKAKLPRYVAKHFIRIHEKPTRKRKSKKAVIHVVTKKRDSV